MQTVLLITFITTTDLTIINKASNEILFKPLGQLIPELSWATIRIHLNISHTFEETDELCKASYLMYMEDAKINLCGWLLLN